MISQYTRHAVKELLRTCMQSVVLVDPGLAASIEKLQKHDEEAVLTWVLRDRPCKTEAAETFRNQMRQLIEADPTIRKSLVFADIMSRPT